MSITDTSDIPIVYISMSLVELTDSFVFVIKVPCLAQLFLASVINVSAQVLARLNGTADAFVDIAVSPIDLTAFAGETKLFDMKVHANNINGLVHAALPVRLTYNP